MRSMTGFGRYGVKSEALHASFEIRTVNSKGLDLVVRVPKNYLFLEEMIRNRAKEHFARGRVEIYLSLEDLGERKRNVTWDRDLVYGYKEALKEIQEEFGQDFSFSVRDLLALPDLFSLEALEVDEALVSSQVEEALRGAILGVEGMRKVEGEMIAYDLTDKCREIAHLVSLIATRASVVPTLFAERLRARLAELLKGTSLTEERFQAEVAVFADRSSIDEELTRMKGHLGHFEESMKALGPLGRKLDFLVQEMNREMNTLGAKANDLEITGWVVEGKSLLEKMREQIQNIE